MAAPIRSTHCWHENPDTIIDVRSPAEFADDHIPGAINLPVLDDVERADIGTIYKQQSPFEARKLGAALTATNIARHLKAVLLTKPSSWQPLIYCWRGGHRSQSMAHILAEIGWRVSVLEGGYKSYRRQVMAALEDYPATMPPVVLLQGPTGCAKTHILQAVMRQKGQAIDLEALACHRGSLLGAEPDETQPSQRYFESLLYADLCKLTPSSAVLIEAESSRIGQCHIPCGLWRKMAQAPRIRISAPLAARIEFLKRDYPHLMTTQPNTDEHGGIAAIIAGMVHRHGHSVCDAWGQLAQSQQWDALIAALITEHYDPAYKKASLRSKGRELGVVEASVLDDAAFCNLAGSVMGLMDKAV